MKFTIIGHACLFIETGSQTILVDPWLSGSCYWRSWWHFPPNTDIRPEFLNPDYIYLSHHHFDHFHYPSLRRIAKTARVLIPRFGVDVMRHELDQLGFKDVTELPHGESLHLVGGTRLASYQYGPDDSAVVVERDGIVFADLNDCKITGAAAVPMLRSFGQPTFIFKSHSFAQAYPNCYNAADPAEAKLMTREDFFETFGGAIHELSPQYAIPFASMVAFLHPESRQCNVYAVRPPEVVAEVQNKSRTATSTVAMIPGDTWDSSVGFKLQPNDYYENITYWIDKLGEQHSASILKEDTAEEGITLEFPKFQAHFENFLSSLPVFSWLVLKCPVVFHIPSDPAPYWIIDFRTRKVTRRGSPPENHASIVHIREAILADAISKNIVSFVHISMRIRIDLAAGGSPVDFLFWGLVSIQELGYLPLYKDVTPRAIGVLWRRRHEVWSLLRPLLGFQSFHKVVLGSLVKRREDL
jgi:UDP-MurNAc hydroxylase